MPVEVSTQVEIAGRILEGRSAGHRGGDARANRTEPRRLKQILESQPAAAREGRRLMAYDRAWVERGVAYARSLPAK